MKNFLKTKGLRIRKVCENRG